MINPRNFLIAGGVISGLIALLHLTLAMKPSLYRYVIAGIESDLGRMAERGSTPTTLATVALAVVFAVWAVYAFSGAGMTVRMPLMRAALIAICVIYILRALALPTELKMVMNQGYPLRMVVYSAISLLAGLLYLIGLFTPRVPSP